MRLIDADALLKGRQDHTYISTHEIWNASTVDPIKHGRWVWVNGWVSCSVCGCEPPSETNITSNYCPNCGAKMDGIAIEKSDTYSVDNNEEETDE